MSRDRRREPTREERIIALWAEVRSRARDVIWRQGTYEALLRKPFKPNFRDIPGAAVGLNDSAERIQFVLEHADPPSRHWRVMCGGILVDEGHR